MNETIKLGTVLLVISAVSAAILAFVNSFTSVVIAENEFETTVASYYEIYGDAADEFEPFDEAELVKIQEEYPNVENIFVAKKGGETVGHGININVNGFGGEMTNAIGFLNEGPSITGFRNISHQETSGFGSQITENFYYDTYNEKDASQPLTGSPDGSGPNDAMLISGSTVTSNAVLASVNEAIEVNNSIVE